MEIRVSSRSMGSKGCLSRAFEGEDVRFEGEGVDELLAGKGC